MGEYLNKHYNEIFKKYSTEELLRDIQSYQLGKGKLNKVLNHFFEECMYNCIGSKYNLSPMQALSDDDIMYKIIDYTKSKPNFYTGNEIANIKSFFRNGTNYARKVANFCPKNARDIYFRYYDINGDRINCLDTSMGFGSRMSAVLLSGHNYCGFDPNLELFKQLKTYKKFLKDNNILSTTQRCGLYNTGSEVFKTELINLFDVSFTSPPYFNLEHYFNDNGESTINYNNYNLWLENFVIPTIENTYHYLKVGAYAMINIKNLNSKGKEPLFDDWFKIFSNHSGFEFVEIFEMNHQTKKHYTEYYNSIGMNQEYNGFKEPIMVFRKVK